MIEDNLNPILFEAVEIEYEFEALNNAPPVILNVWDKDHFSDDFLGRAVIYLDNASISEDDMIPEPKWHDIRMGFDTKDASCG